MDWQFIVAVNVVAVSLLTLVAGLLNRQGSNLSMLLLHGLIVAVGAGALYFELPYAGTLLAAMFLILIALPGLLLHASNRNFRLARHGAAARYAWLAAVVHPSPSLRDNARILSALAETDPERSAAALERLRDAARGAKRDGIELQIARLRGRWDEVLAFVRRPGNRAPGLAAFEIRALGELGRTDEMVEAYERQKTKLGNALLEAQLFVLAFCGDRRLVAQMRGPQGRLGLHDEIIAYWEAVAACNAPGLREEGRALLAALAQSGMPGVRFAAQRYLGLMEIAPPAAPSPHSLAVAAAIAKRWQESQSLRSVPSWRRPVTMTLIAANAAMFAVEHWFGGVENPMALFRLGALEPQSVVEGGEWWRLGAAMFLHYGWAHFLINMFSLLVLGRLVESALGSWRMLTIYLVGGLGSMAVALGASEFGLTQSDFLVGASGAIMALFGAWAAWLIVRWVRSRDALDRLPAIWVMVLLALQSGIDLMVPQISFTAHLSGFIVGFVLGLGLGRRLATPAALGSEPSELGETV
jgi:rhomboid protease GluP